ncbi:beta/alpha barrel domain-containing protein [Micromonospora fluostatini]|uniref:hypothetical protein n=1 Tax=Micromonospora sp. JCM 30529 TaxID=3421643 RepID=UPI003D180184
MKSKCDITLLDVTLRDGGYVNGHSWTTREAEAIVRAVGAAGVPYVEVGYLREAHQPHRPSASCPPGYLDALAAVADRPQLTVMVRPGEVPVSRIAELPGCGVSMVRVLVPSGAVATAAPYVEAARATGLAVATNLTRVSERKQDEIAAVIAACVEAGAHLVERLCHTVGAGGPGHRAGARQPVRRPVRGGEQADPGPRPGARLRRPVHPAAAGAGRRAAARPATRSPRSWPGGTRRRWSRRRAPRGWPPPPAGPSTR